jgi:hypothetical protein
MIVYIKSVMYMSEHVNEFCRCCNASLINNIRRYMEIRFNSELAQAEAQANSRAR